MLVDRMGRCCVSGLYYGTRGRTDKISNALNGRIIILWAMKVPQCLEQCSDAARKRHQSGREEQPPLPPPTAVGPAQVIHSHTDMYLLCLLTSD